MKIAPSILASDFSKLGEEIKRMEDAKADLIHIDIMDGHFVPNITFGPDVIKSLRKYATIPFDVHLMIDHPLEYVERFADAGADIITFHVEAKDDIKETIEKIKSLGIKPGLVIKPNTPAEAVFPYLEDIYMVLIMTVEPGFGGQSFMADMLPKVSAIKNKAKEIGTAILIEADGGINMQTASQASAAGIDIAVSGTGVFKAEDPAEAIRLLQNA
ncbi:MAG: ribulose-phosphate 3-epimerase [Clostridia bacterium]|nr:ribulose-phosphate 3-epimerase [Clostridia bacterium]